MRNSGLRLIRLDKFDRQPTRNYPGGYICLIRDVDFGDRYQLIRLRSPKELSSHYAASFVMDLTAAWHAKDAESAERKLRAELSSGAASGEWFDLDRDQLRELVGVQPPAARRQTVSRPQPAIRRQPAARRQARRTTARPRVAPMPPAVPAARPGGARRLATIAIALLLMIALLAPAFEGIAGLKPLAIGRDAAPQTPRSLTQPTVYGPRFNMKGSLLLRWTGVHGAEAYEYRWSVNGGKLTPPVQTRALQKSIHDLSPGDVVKFQVRARNGARRSPFAIFTARLRGAKQAESPSQEETATLAMPRLNPAKLSTNTSGKTTVLFSWQPVSGAAKYTFRWYLNGSDLYRNFSGTRRTEWSICCRSAGDSIRFEVWANRDTRSSAVASVTVQVPAEDSAAQAVETSAEPLSAGGRMIVRTTDMRSVHIRDCPSTQCAVVGRLMNGAQVQALEAVHGEAVDGDPAWIRIDFQGRSRAFVHAPLLEPAG